MYGLPHTKAISSNILKERLALAGYFEVTHTPGMWTYITRPVQFTLVLDDSCVKFTSKEDTDHLVRALKNNYKIATDWTGLLYCGMVLQWDYEQCTLDFSRPGYI